MSASSNENTGWSLAFVRVTLFMQQAADDGFTDIWAAAGFNAEDKRNSNRQNLPIPVVSETGVIDGIEVALATAGQRIDISMRLDPAATDFGPLPTITNGDAALRAAVLAGGRLAASVQPLVSRLALSIDGLQLFDDPRSVNEALLEIHPGMPVSASTFSFDFMRAVREALPGSLDVNVIERWKAARMHVSLTGQDEGAFVSAIRPILQFDVEVNTLAEKDLSLNTDEVTSTLQVLTKRIRHSYGMTC